MEIQDYDGHLRAIHGLASTLELWQRKWDEAAKEASARADLSQHEIDDVISIFYDAGFAELARSHAFICTIAAFVESLFCLSLPKVGEDFRGTLVQNHPRVLKLGETSSFWDPRKSEKDGSGIAQRIGDILDGANLVTYFGADFGQVCAAVFAYRNNMVHNGYEWTLKKRRHFKSLIRAEGWSDWFSIATTDNDPWYFTMTPSFYDTCLRRCNRALLAFNGLLYGEWDRYEVQYPDTTKINGQ